VEAQGGLKTLPAELGQMGALAHLYLHTDLRLTGQEAYLLRDRAT
jgi:hypothetical protein